MEEANISNLKDVPLSRVASLQQAKSDDEKVTPPGVKVAAFNSSV